MDDDIPINVLVLKREDPVPADQIDAVQAKFETAANDIAFEEDIIA